MKQVLQNLRTGKVEVADVPAPAVRPAHLLVRTAATLISPGTERMLVEFGQAGLLGKARAQPEKAGPSRPKRGRCRDALACRAARAAATSHSRAARREPDAALACGRQSS